MHASLDVVVAGHLCLDVTPAFPQGLGSDPSAVFAPGRLVRVGPATLSTGGAVSNTGLSLLRMGLKAELMAKIGEDVFGEAIRRLCAQAGAERGLVVVAGEQSSYSCVLAAPGIDRIILHCPGANDTFCADDVDYALVREARLFHFGYPCIMERFYADEGELARMYERVKSGGTITSLDQSYPDPASPGGRADWEAILGRALPHVDVFLPSAEESLLMFDRPRFEARRREAGGRDLTKVLRAEDVRMIADRLLDMGVGIAGVKCGVRGLYLRTAADLGRVGGAGGPPAAAWADRELWTAPFRVPVVSATGSGDSAIAAFLAAFLRGLGPEEALRAGCVAGALSVQTLDVVSGMLPFDEMLARAEALRERLPLDPGEGWRYDGACACWRGPLDSRA